MQISQTLEHLAQGNIHNEIYYDGTLLRNICQHVENCWEPRSPIQHGATRIKCLSWPLSCPARNLHRTRELMQEEETHNLPETLKDGWRHSTPRAQRYWRFQGVIMLALSGMRGCQQITLWKVPKVKSCLSHLREKMPLWKHLILGQITSLHIEVGRNVCWNKNNTMLVSQIQYLSCRPAWKERRHSTNLITQ